MDLQPEINNERAALEWDWLCEEVGVHKARAAIADLPGHRRPYPLNIIKQLGLKCPATLPVQCQCVFRLGRDGDGPPPR